MGYSIPYELFEDPEPIVVRKELMSQLRAILKMQPKLPAFRMAHLWGKQGCGKTTLARQYAKTYHEELSFVFWVRAESWATVTASYIEFANTLIQHYSERGSAADAASNLGLDGVEEMLKVKNVMQLGNSQVRSVIRAIKDWMMQPENNQWLLIIDHVEPSYDVHELIPLTLSGKVILTSRDEQSCTWGTKVSVDTMAESEASELLCRIVGTDTADGQGMTIVHKSNSSTNNIAQDATAAAVVRRLEYHASAIAKAGATIKAKDNSISEYEANINNVVLPSSIDLAVDTSPNMKALLRLSAMLALEPIPVATFTTHIQEDDVPIQFRASFGLLQSKSFGDELQHSFTNCSQNYSRRCICSPH